MAKALTQRFRFESKTMILDEPWPDEVTAGWEAKPVDRAYFKPCGDAERRNVLEEGLVLYRRTANVYVVCRFDPITEHATSGRIIDSDAAERLMAKAFEPDFSVAGLLAKLDIRHDSLNAYAKAAGVTTPRQGQKNFQYGKRDVQRICRYMIANGKSVEAATALLDEILNPIIR